MHPPTRTLLAASTALGLAIGMGGFFVLAEGIPSDTPAATAESPPAADAPIDPAGLPPDIRPPTPEEQAGMDEAYRRMRAALDAGDPDAAEPHARALLALEERTWGPKHPWTGATRVFLAEIHRARGNPAAAEAEQRRAVEISTARLGPAHPDTLADAARFAADLAALGRAEAARQMAQATAETARRAGPDALLAEFDALHVVAGLAEAAEDDATAAQALGRMVEIATALLGPDDPVTASWRTRRDTARAQPASRLHAAGHAAHRAGEFAAAERAFREALEICERVLGPEHPDTLVSLNNLAETLRALGRAAEAEPLHRRALETRERVLGPEHPDALASLNNLGLTLDALGRTAEAEPLHRRALEVSERVLGLEHPDTLISLNNLAETLGDLGRSAEAEPLHRRALKSFERVLGPEHPSTLTSLSNLAATIDALGRTAEAEPLHRRVLETRERVLGPEHPDTLASLNNLAVTLDALGRAAEAEPLHRRVLGIRERVLGPEHPDTLISLSNLAATLRALGRAAEAEPLDRRVLEARERVLGPEHPSTLVSLSNLAETLRALGRAAEAEPLNRRALETFERVLGSEHPSTLISLSNLAATIDALGRTAEAEPLHRRVLEIRERVLGPEHPDMLNSLSNLAVTLEALGRAAEAEPLHRRVLQIRERVLGPEHPDTLTSLGNLAATLGGLGRSAEAVPLQYRVLEIRERVLGPEHPDTLIGLGNLAWMLMALDRPLEALGPARRALAGRLAGLGSASGSAEATREAAGSEAADAGWLVARAAWGAAQAGGGAAPEDRPAALRAEGFAAIQAAGRGGGAGEAIARSAARVAAGEAGLAEVVGGWERALAAREALDRDFVAAAAAGPEADPATRAAIRAHLAAQRAALDAEIAAARARLEHGFPRFFELVSPPPVSVAELQGAGGDALLGAEEALVLLSPGSSDRPGLVWAVSRDGVAWAEIPLGAAELSERIGRLHALLGGGGATRAPMTGDDAGGPAVPGARGYDRALALELYQALFGAPEIQAVIGAKPDWVLVPQGALLSLPFAALVTAAPEGADDDPAALRASAWLGLERALAVVPSVSTVRSLRRLGRERAAGPGMPFFGLGDPAFSGAPAEARGAPVRLAAAAGFFRDAAGDVAAVRGLPRLPGTRREVERMAASFGAGPESYLLGAEANETRLAALSDAGRLGRARVVLFATHGLVAGAFDGLAEPALALSPPAEGPRLIDPAPPEASLGAAVAQGARLDDGLLTASEAARLALDADWVILSACDTAAGGAPDAEGLSGLARAFFHAGARSLLVSHWPVRDDLAARLTTDAVSRAATEPGLTRARAFQAAMRALIEDPSQDATGQSLAHPAAWAPFQIIGVQ